MRPAETDPSTGELLAAVERIREAIVSGHQPSDPSSRFAALARDYGDDADAGLSRARRLGYAALAMLTAGVALALAGIVDARDGDSFQFDRFGAYALVSLAVIGAAALVFREATVRQRSALEARRLQRQLQGLEPYLADLPSPLSHLLRGTLASSLFPPLPGEEPWRQPRWPEPGTILDALRPTDDQR